MANAVVTKTIAAQNTFTDWLKVLMDATTGGKYSVMVKGVGAFTAIVSVQWSEDGVTILDDSVETFTASTTKIGQVAEQLYVRVGVKTGDYTIGTINVRVGQKQ
jgi:hypothetical protein